MVCDFVTSRDFLCSEILLNFTGFEVPEAKKPVEEKVPVVSVPERKEVPAPKGRDG